ncbi:hypothetical protein OG625_28730 [Streptomyces sp. NBC_01351]|uniref:hypothetical protein n=1 Tax=Streptomyces sp. NBC_01351 TaxID=2903833 RepID=UPI002E307980|nr:hypothetical protein [Streptomyces sp. NBC_01351]
MSRAEAEKVARLLGEEELGFLRGLPTQDVRRFREQASAVLNDGAPEMLDRIAAATKLVPAGVAAAISQKALGPRLAAAVAGRLEAGRAADIIAKLPVSFTAESCGHLDPRKIAGIVDRLDEGLVVRIAVALAEKGDHLTMGRFVGHMRDQVLGRILGQVGDADVLKAGFYVDQPERLPRILELMGDERLGAVVRAAAADGLWEEALAVAASVGGEQRLRIAQLTARLDAADLDSLVRVTHAEGLWEALLPLVALLGEEDRLAVARLESLRDPLVLAGVVAAVVATGLWGEFLPLVGVLPEDARKVVADAAAGLGDGELDALVREVDKRDLWELVLPLVERMEEAGKERIFALPAFQDQS